MLTVYIYGCLGSFLASAAYHEAKRDFDIKLNCPLFLYRLVHSKQVRLLLAESMDFTK